MTYVVKMPKLGLEMEQGTVLEWFPEIDEPVSEGDTIAEVESEKSIGEVNARGDGVLRRIYVEVGETVAPGSPIGIFGASDEDISELETKVESELDLEDEGEDEEEDAQTTGSAGADSGEMNATSTDKQSESGDVKVSPRARQRAEYLDVDLGTVEGSGFEGSITEADVEAAAESDGSSTTADVKASPRARQRAEDLDVDLGTVVGSGFEGSITEEDVEAAAEAGGSPTDDGYGKAGFQAADSTGTERYRSVTSIVEPSAGTELIETMEAVRTAFDERVTLTDVLYLVASATLEDCPLLNGFYTESTHQVREHHRIALLTGESSSQILDDVQNKTLADIVDARENHNGADDDPEPATFSVANVSSTDTVLVNPPAVAALGVDPTGQRAVPTDDGVDLQPLISATLTYDPRAISTADAEAYLEQFTERAAQASALVLQSYHGHE